METVKILLIITSFFAALNFIFDFFKTLRNNGYKNLKEKYSNLLLEHETLLESIESLNNSPTGKQTSPLTQRKLIKSFTTAELKVAAILVEGLEDKEIAKKLGNSTYTINQHIRNMREKAACRNTKELIAYLLRNDIV